MLLVEEDEAYAQQPPPPALQPPPHVALGHSTSAYAAHPAPPAAFVNTPGQRSQAAALAPPVHALTPRQQGPERSAQTLPSRLPASDLRPFQTHTSPATSTPSFGAQPRQAGPALERVGGPGSSTQQPPASASPPSAGDLAPVSFSQGVSPRPMPPSPTPLSPSSSDSGLQQPQWYGGASGGAPSTRRARTTNDSAMGEEDALSSLPDSLQTSPLLLMADPASG